MKMTGLLLLLCCISLLVSAQEVLLKSGMKISTSVSIRKNNYMLQGVKDKPVILVEGNNIIIDFNHAVIKGNSAVNKPDAFTGIAILVQNSTHVTIKNLHVNGYKVALLVKNVQWLTLDNCDLSYNYRQHLNSTQEKEDISDWMSYHQNEKDEWLRYGAAIYLNSCDNAVIRNCTVTGGQNALMMMKCRNGFIYNNDFSFNSGIGIGLYRSSNNKIIYNRVIFNVRGYSDGVYNRGQDSAGMLVYEQSNNNFFYGNNVTHGGDGFFLWAGQTTMDNGSGGCNDNVLYQNDFSYAPTNGIEVTFSRNTIVQNKMFECDHGIWGGYSFETIISQNLFGQNRIAIAIEHGLKNRIEQNNFSGNKEAIRLWARKEQPADWGYAKYRDTRSARYVIAENTFTDNPLVYNFNRTDSLFMNGNSFNGNNTIIFKTDSTVTGLDTLPAKSGKHLTTAIPEIALPAGETAKDVFAGTEKFAGRKNIMITEWGPYDFRYPFIRNTNPTDSSGIMKFDLFGPKGKWKIKSIRGVKNISLKNGSFPASITAEKLKNAITDIRIELEYTGESFTNEFGKRINAGSPYRFSFTKFFQPIDWTVRFFAMDTSVYNPLKEKSLFAPNVRVRPVKTEQVNKLEYAWWGGIKAEEQYQQFMTIAEGNAVIQPGTYELSVTWDDAVRVYIDSKLVLNEWNPSRYTFDESPNKKIKIKLGGSHQFRVEHLETGGFATLSLRLNQY